MKYSYIIYFSIITIFLLIPMGLLAGGSCEEPSYPDQVLFEPEPSPETCEGQWVRIYEAEPCDFAEGFDDCGKAEYRDTNICVRGRYKIEEIFNHNAGECLPFWIERPCTVEEVMAVVAILCAGFSSNHMRSCVFEHTWGPNTEPLGDICPDDKASWKWDGYHAIDYSVSSRQQYRVYEWKCN